MSSSKSSFSEMHSLTDWQGTRCKVIQVDLEPEADLGIAEKFNVSLPFVLQQAAWLYERQLSQVRAQMRKVGAPKSSTPVPGGDSTGSEAMRRTGSGGGGIQALSFTSVQHSLVIVIRAPSSMSTRKDSPIPKPDSSVSNTPRSMGEFSPSRAHDQALTN
jgi:hypothetical protein